MARYRAWTVRACHDGAVDHAGQEPSHHTRASSRRSESGSHSAAAVSAASRWPRRRRRRRARSGRRRPGRRAVETTTAATPTSGLPRASSRKPGAWSSNGGPTPGLLVRGYRLYSLVATAGAGAFQRQLSDPATPHRHAGDASLLSSTSTAKGCRAPPGRPAQRPGLQVIANPGLPRCHAWA